MMRALEVQSQLEISDESKQQTRDQFHEQKKRVRRDQLLASRSPLYGKAAKALSQGIL